MTMSDQPLWNTWGWGSLRCVYISPRHRAHRTNHLQSDHHDFNDMFVLMIMIMTTKIKTLVIEHSAQTIFNLVIMILIICSWWWSSWSWQWRWRWRRWLSWCQRRLSWSQQRWSWCQQWLSWCQQWLSRCQQWCSHPDIIALILSNLCSKGKSGETHGCLVQTWTRCWCWWCWNSLKWWSPGDEMCLWLIFSRRAP